MILDYVLKFHFKDCLDILSEQDPLGYFSVKIDFMNLFETHPDIGDRVLCTPTEVLPLCHQDIIKAQQNILENEEYTAQVSKLGYSSLKRNVHARFFSLPVCPELHRTVFPKNGDLGCFLKVTGTIVRVTQAKMLEYHRKYVCIKCRHENYVEAQFEHRYILKAPTKCANDVKSCKNTVFTQVNMVSREHCKDYQEIKIQEQLNKLSIGFIPGSMWVVLEDDLVDSCKPGDDVNICGTVRRRWRPAAHGRKSEVELVLQANYIRVCNAQRSEVVAAAPDVRDCFDDFWAKFGGCPLKGRDVILRSVCPQVYGLHLVKLALLLTVITGSDHIPEGDDKRERQQATRVRGQSHLLLVGDPGTGKSQLLKAGAELTPRSVLTSGAGSTNAGLTCSALREDGEWVLEAGALVLSDGGACCIDEIGQLQGHDRAAIHEAMEQQTVSVAKAGIVCKLNTRCAVIAACNPRGHYDTSQPLSANVSLGTPLLSRFDLIFIMLDTKNKAWDRLVSSYILFGGDGGAEADAKKQWSLEKLQMYISLVGPRRTDMSAPAHSILRAYYMAQRKCDRRDPARTTVRMLDSLVRLSQAHCRLMYRTTILPVDAVVAVSLVDLSMQDCTLKDTVAALHSTFHRYPDFDYLCTAKKLLNSLNLYTIWQEELLHYAKILQVDKMTLSNDIEKERWQLFTKFDDVSDDNIQLSSSLITSSYFKKKEDKVERTEDGEDKEVGKKLSETLKKITALKKDERLPMEQMKKSKRKRKEVVVDTSRMALAAKRVKKTGRKRIENDSTNSKQEVDNENALKAVPSVNDVFTELGIDFNFGSDDEDKTTNSKEVDTVTDGKPNYKNNTSCDTKVATSDNETKSSTSLKFKQFQYVGTRDLSKYEERKEMKKEEDVAKLKSVLIPETTSVESKRSLPSSQLSIFETSDCDIDLDL